MPSDIPPVLYVHDPEESLQETLDRLQEITGWRNGYGRSIELILPEISLVLEKLWLSMFPKEFKEGWIRQLKDNKILEEIPDIGEGYPETNPENLITKTTDSPQTKSRSQIRYHIARTEPAGFNKKMFSNVKELGPRFRFWLAKPRAQDSLYEFTKVLTKTNEHLIEWEIYARNKSECHYYFKCLEYIFYNHSKIFLELGLQRFIPIGSTKRMEIDKSNNMYKRTLSTYFRTEEYFYEPPVIELTGASLNWNDFNMGFDES